MAIDRTPVILVLTSKGLELAARVAAALPDAEIHGLATRVPDAAILFDRVADHLREIFRSGRPIIGICSSAVLIRTLGPIVSDKHGEPPVLALAEDGSAVVPLLGGHRGGNRLARRIAEVLQAMPAITTAGDLRFGVALDDPPPGWRMAEGAPVKYFMAALLDCAKVRLEGRAPWLSDSDLPISDEGALTILVTEKAEPVTTDRLIFHPARVAIGVGCERGTDPDELMGLVRDTLAENGLAPEAVAGIFSLDLKADEPAVHAVAGVLGVTSRFFDAATLEAEADRLQTPSELVYREVGCHGVAEGAALAAAGPRGELIVPKTKTRRATCAIALAPDVLDVAGIGRPRGTLSIVGLGPGAEDWRTPEADAAVRAATDLVGYGLYLDLLGAAAEGKARRDYALGEEEARCRAALDLAAEGRSVALICSGDPGIYAMAALVYELLDCEDRPEWRRAAVTVVPGISALQAAAARVGAPLGHDFCAISLSDLLTPWPVIERRLRAAAEGDFVVALYNPVSRKRTRQIEIAKDILSANRSPQTPVVLARNLGREGESVEIISLEELEAARVDMLTVVLIGSNSSRAFQGSDGRRMYTPRGYAAKREEAAE